MSEQQKFNEIINKIKQKIPRDYSIPDPKIVKVLKYNKKED
ncbi:hypothetical protein [Halalkalibacterium halodurans]|nr:hypothetical protein [Halalkalibacterium halodurans]